MAISERINPDNLNIHQFQEAPEARSELHTDLEALLTPQAREQVQRDIIHGMRSMSGTLDKVFYLVEAKCFLLLWPKVQLDFGVDDPTLSEYAKNSVKINMYVGVDILACAKIVRPELDLGVTPDEWNNALEDQNTTNAYYYAMAKVLDPKINFPREYFKQIEEDYVEPSRKSRQWEVFLEYASSLKILDPFYSPNITEEEGDELLKYVEREAEEGRWRRFAEAAGYLKILAAHKVTVTAPGVIEFQMHPPEDVATQTPPMPETRKF